MNEQHLDYDYRNQLSRFVSLSLIHNFNNTKANSKLANTNRLIRDELPRS